MTKRFELAFLAAVLVQPAHTNRGDGRLYSREALEAAIDHADMILDRAERIVNKAAPPGPNPIEQPSDARY